MKILLTLFALILLAHTQKVKVDFYYESLCPYCQQYMQKSLKIASQTEVICH